jgi:protein CpxP
MTSIRKSILIGLTVLGLGAGSVSVQAHEAGQQGREQMHAKWGERAAMKQKKLHDALMLTPSQQAAWVTYSAASKPADRGQRGERGQRGDWKALSAPQRMEKRIEMAKQRVNMMESRLAALNTFYAVLTPQQKATFDANSKGRGGHRMHHMKHGMKHGMKDAAQG